MNAQSNVSTPSSIGRQLPGMPYLRSPKPASCIASSSVRSIGRPSSGVSTASLTAIDAGQVKR